ncbi:phosphonate C-P lyase system protein PhnG [Candidatus Chloroploca sp. M-50]|uniref:Phosphonate C-P lyase system protein PhnG n=1 Tax=Candidatus Chloroploca mongolica TaxID=2528176 RepID=A0ABS4D723_9CHLR|nr:phosphonate C-P lyase system protein PhnG [Candidatus Chloroploca mongolica]MBP1465242.1 phosphonate C-P lyase system protein PhnG [Candidatus Chloroploca mongolica]
MLMQAHELLDILTRSPADAVKRFAEDLLPRLEPVEVLRNRTGLAMLPFRETAQESSFYLGEILLAEAHVRVAGVEGYAACLGRDLEQALALALIDAAHRAGIAGPAIADFARVQAADLVETDEALMRAVGQTRVDLETF